MYTQHQVELQHVKICDRRLVLGNISTFWEHRDISLDNISYHGHFLILKYCITIFIDIMYGKDECNDSL